MDKSTIFIDNLPKTAVDPEKLASAFENSDDQIDKYIITSLIGEGGAGLVYKSYDTVLGRNVAIKVLKEEFRDSNVATDRFINEARGAAQLEHPNIIPIHELGYSNKYGCFFSMKKMQGDSLKEKLSNIKHSENPLKEYDIIELLEIFIKICYGAAFIHSRNIIHRDLKSENIIVGEFGEVMIIDWGLLKEFKHDNGEKNCGNKINLKFKDLGLNDSNHTMRGAINGTPSTMSPEQACGRYEMMDQRSDIYSLGVILFEILTLTTPFTGNEVNEVLSKVVKGEFEFPNKLLGKRKIPHELKAICLKAMQANLHNRYYNVEDMIDDIRNYLGDKPISVYHGSCFYRSFQLAKRHKQITATIISMLVTFITIVSYIYIRAEATISGQLQAAEMLAQKATTAIDKNLSIHKKLEELTRERNLDEFFSLRQQFRQNDDSINYDTSSAISIYLTLARAKLFHGSAKLARKRIIGVYNKKIDYRLKTGQWKLVKVIVNNIKRELNLSEVDEEMITDPTNRTIVNNILSECNVLCLDITPLPEKIELQPISETIYGTFQLGKPINYDLEANCVKIPVGRYIATATMPDKAKHQFSLSISYAEQEKLSFQIPKNIDKSLCFIPAGKFLYGGNKSNTKDAYPITLPSFLIKRHEVSFGEYFEFWQTLSETQKERYMPQLQLNKSYRQYISAWDQDGKLRSFCKADEPVVGITHEAAESYCKWLSTIVKKKVRLPDKFEWEKAARGTDGRSFVWGNDRSATNAFVSINQQSHYTDRAPCGSFEADISSYGVQDMCGNVREWTSSILNVNNNLYIIKGASVFSPSSYMYCNSESFTTSAPSDIGFRYVIEVE